MNSSAEEDDLEQVSWDLPWLDLKVPSRSAPPAHQGLPLPGKLQSGNSVLSILIYEPTQALGHFESCSCPLILDLVRDLQ